MDALGDSLVHKGVEQSVLGTPGSKRKRHTQPDSVTYSPRHLAADSLDQYHSPKRSRTNRLGSEDEIEHNDAPVISARNIRRIKGKYSLSTLSRRHAPEPQRPSKFLEGSMNDRPSEKPPSVFIRAPTNPNVVAGHVDIDHLMDQYHQGELQAVEEPDANGHATRTDIHIQRGAAATPALSENRDSGIYKFGRIVASSFNPVNVWKSWSRTWEETKDELTIQNIEENRRRAGQKLEAEQKYASMKRLGSFGGQTTLAIREQIVESGPDATGEDEASTCHRDSAVDMEAAKTSSETANRSSTHTVLIQRPDQHNHGRTDTPAYDESSPDKTLKSRKSMFHIRAPSLSSIKRVRSEYHLAPSGDRSSTSPEKLPSSVKNSTLRQSHSRKDLHRQQKLNKRVSNLEDKLEEARRELSAAIVNASPLPDLPSRFEKYTPTFKLTRPKFVPSGNLPSLPSERLLFSSLRGKKRTPSYSNILPIDSDVNSPFTFAAQSDTGAGARDSDTEDHSVQSRITAIHEPTRNELSAMDPSTYMTEPGPPPAQHEDEEPQYETLDAKLKALETSHKAGKGSRKTTAKTKKRKSMEDDDKLFRPGKNDKDDDDDYEEVDAKQRKKRKPATKPVPKTERIIIRKKSFKKNKVATKAPAKDVAEEDQITTDNTTTSTADFLIANKILDPMPRASMDSQLEPISEEDNIVVAQTGPGANEVDEEDEPVTATPGVGSVPEMPSLATAVQQKRGDGIRHASAASKGPVEGFEWPEDVF